MNNYDNIIKNAVSVHLNYTDWRLLKAQLMAESELNPNAVSNAGAKGIAQFMPDTWEEVTTQMGIAGADITDPSAAIPACAFYMTKLISQWSAPRPIIDRYALALASYNGGTGNLLKAQKAAGMVNDYKTIISRLPDITGKDNARQTSDYVRKIYGYYLGYVVGL